MTLMTEVFDAWAAEHVQKQPSPYVQPYAQPYQQTQQYPPGQPYPHVQLCHQVQATYNYNSLAQIPAVPHQGHGVPPVYNSPAPLHAVPNDPYGYRQPEVVELLAELPGATILTAPAPVPMRSMSTDVSTSSFELLARDLSGADFNPEEEKVAV
jgi:hypothetical protein